MLKRLDKGVQLLLLVQENIFHHEIVVNPENKNWVERYSCLFPFSVLNSFYSFNQQKEDNKWIGQEEKGVNYKPQNFQTTIIYKSNNLHVPHIYE